MGNDIVIHSTVVVLKVQSAVRAAEGIHIGVS